MEEPLTKWFSGPFCAIPKTLLSLNEMTIHLISMKKTFLLPILLFLALQIQAQYLTGISSYYDDSFVEWRFYAENEAGDEDEGTLKITWQLREDDWTEWDYRIGEAFGSIKMKWKDNPEEWELRGGNRIVTARTVWPGQFTEWRITDNTTTLTLKSKWTNQSDEWLLRDSNYGDFLMYSSYERDSRDWVIEDGLNDKVNFELKLMMMFMVMFNSTPKQ
jgi:hypothetical protein